MTGARNAQLPEQKRSVINLLGQGKSLRQACKEAGMAFGSLTHYRKGDPIFDAAISKATGQRMPPALVIKDRVRVEVASLEEKEAALKKVVEALERGLSFEYACLHGSVSPSLVKEWMHADPAIMDSVNRSEGKFQLFCIQKIMRAADEDWHAAAWLLERRYPAFWAEVKTVELAARHGGALVNPAQATAKDAEVIDVQPEDLVKRVKQMSDAELRAAFEKSNGRGGQA